MRGLRNLGARPPGRWPEAGPSRRGSAAWKPIFDVGGSDASGTISQGLQGGGRVGVGWSPRVCVPRWRRAGGKSGAADNNGRLSSRALSSSERGCRRRAVIRWGWPSAPPTSTSTWASSNPCQGPLMSIPHARRGPTAMHPRSPPRFLRQRSTATTHAFACARPRCATARGEDTRLAARERVCSRADAP